MLTWSEITKALAALHEPTGRKLGKGIADFMMNAEIARPVERRRAVAG